MLPSSRRHRGSSRRVWTRRLCLPLVLALALLAAVPPTSGGFWRSPAVPWSSLFSWLAAPPAWASDPKPPTPVQQTGSAAGKPSQVSTSATRAGRGAGRAPGLGRGQLSAYQPPARAAKPVQTDTVKGVFNKATSRRDGVKSTATSTWFANADGSVTRDVYPGPANYRAGDGTFQPIDTTLVGAASGFAEKANGIGVELAATADAVALGSVQVDAAHSVGYALAGAAAVAPQVGDSTATYPSVLPHTDVRLTTLTSGLETEFVLDSVLSARQFVLPLRLTGLTPRISADGSVEFVDSGSKVELTVPPGTMMDSDWDPNAGGGAESRGVHYALITSGGGPALQVTLDGTWLDDPGRVYPVVVDPATIWTTASTYAENSNPGNNSGSTHLKVGTPDAGGGTSNTARSFLQFGDLSAIAGQQVSQVDFTINDAYALHCSNPEPFTVGGVNSAWSPSGITNMSTAPGVGTPYTSISIQAGSNICANTSWNTGTYQTMTGTFNAAGVAAVQSWVLGGNNFGLSVTASETDRLAWKVFNSTNTSSQPYLSVTSVPDVAPTTINSYPPTNYSTSTLTPELAALAIDPDNWPSALTYTFQVFDPTTGSATPIDSSNPQSTPDWTVNPGKLTWGKTYLWLVNVFDGEKFAPLSANYFSTAVPQPLVTSGLSANDDHGFSPSIANYTTAMTDAQISTVGPALDIERNYNSRDPRVGEAFGAGWSSVLDTHVLPIGNTVVLTYPTGSEVAWGLNVDGSYSSPSGRFATLRATTSPAGFTLTDKNATVYTFARALPAGGYGLTAITDANGRTETFSYNASNQITTITSVSGRALHMTWTTPSGAMAAHVSTVVTDPVVAGQPTSALTWTYSYTSDRLTTVCPPTSTTACHTYGYTAGTLYPSSVLDAGPQAYWPLSDPAGTTTPVNSVLGGVGGAAASTAVTYGGAGGLAGSSATSASFNGTSSYVELPSNLTTSLSYQTVSMWFRTSTPGAAVLYGYEADPVTQATTPGNYIPALYVGADGKLNAQFWTGGVAPIVSGASVVDGAWHQAVLTGSGLTQDLYLDGVHVGSLGGHIYFFPNGAANTTIGSGFFGGSWPDQPHQGGTNWTGYRSPFAGSISDVALYDRALNPTQVTQLYAAGAHAANLLTQVGRPSGRTYSQVAYNGATGLVTTVTDENGSHWGLNPPALQGSSQVYASSVLGSRPTDYWRLGDTGGANAVNQVKGPLATYNAVTLGTAGHFADSTAASFNGTSSYVRLPDNLVNGPTNNLNQTISLWFNTTTPNGVLFSYQQALISAGSTMANYIDALYVGADGKLLGNLWAAPVMSSSVAVTDGKWHQAVLTTSGSSVSLYLDGAPVGTVTGSVNSPQGSGPMDKVYLGTGFIGAAWPDQSHAGQSPATPLYFTGSMADVAYTYTPLSAATVAAQYQAALSSGGQTPTKVVTVTDPGNHTDTYTYDLSNGGRLLTTRDAMGRTTQYGYDTGGFQSTVTDPNGLITTTGHDVRGNVVSSTTCQDQAANKCSTVYYTYYPDDNSVNPPADPRNDLVLTMRDGRSSDAGDNTYLTTYAYDTKGNRTSVTSPPVPGSPSGRVTTMTYTDGVSPPGPAGMPVQTRTPGGAETDATYTSSGDVSTVKVGQGPITSYTYDNLGRALTKTVRFREAPDVSWSDMNVGAAWAQNVTTYSYNGVGQLVTQTDQAVTDRVTGANHTRITTNAYGSDGELLTTTLSDPTGGDASRQTSYTYDAFDRVQTSSDPALNVTSYTYDVFGNTASRTTPGGAETDYAYNFDSQLVTTTLKNYVGDPANPSPPVDLIGNARAYDPAGRLASVSDAMGYVTAYTYTDNGLAATVTRTDDPHHSSASYLVESDTYDAAGNVLSRTTNNGATVTNYTVDAGNRPTLVTVDPSGVNRTTTYTYNPDDHVTGTTVSGGGATVSTTNQYDDSGHLTARTVSDPGHGGPTAWLALDETGGASASDSSGDQHTGTATGGVTLSGGAATLNGTNGFLQTAGPVLDTSAGFTVSAWVNLAANPTRDEIVVGQDSTNQSGFAIEAVYNAATGVAHWALSTPSADTTPLAGVLTSNVAATTGWTHLVAVVDMSTKTTALYVNNSPAATATGTVPFEAAGPLTIGRGIVNGAPADYLAGAVDNVQTYPQALSTAQVNSLYTAGRTGPGLVTGQLTTAYSNDSLGQPLAVTDPDGNTTLYSYDEEGRLTTVTDPVVTTEVNGGPPTATRPVTLTGYDTFGERVESSDPTGNVITYGYDADGRVHTTTLPHYTAPGTSTPIVAVSTNNYDADGKLANQIDALNHQTTYGYDQLGHLATVTTPDTGVTRSTYDLDGELLSTTDPTGAVSQATYDYLGRQATSTDIVRQPSPVADTTTYQYANAGGWLSASTTQNGVVTGYTYDNVGETASITDGAHNTTNFHYDLLGRRVSTVDPTSTAQTVTYDAAGRATATATLDPGGATLASTSAGYDNAGNTVSTTDANTNTTTFSYDATGLLVGEVQPVSTSHSITTSFGYDAAGHRTRFTDGRGNRFLSTYNTWGLPESQVEPYTAAYTTAATSTFTGAYDADGRLAVQTAPGGVQITNGYNTMGALTSQTGTGADAATANRTFGYDLAGRVTSASAGAGTDGFSYDDRGELLTATGPSGAATFSYNRDGLLSSRVDAAGTTSYGYDSADRLGTLTDPSTGTIASYTYNTLSQPSTITYGTGGDTRTFSYDSQHRLSGDVLATGGGNAIASIGYHYDNDSNLTQKTTAGLAGASINTYGYDQANRLTSWNNGTTTVNYGYDDSGNRTQVGAQTYTYDARDELTAANGSTYNYTARGTTSSVVTGGTTVTATDDAYGQTITRGPQTYTYDALGRVLTSAGGTARTFAYSGVGTTLASDGVATYSYDPAGALVGVKGTGFAQQEWTDQHSDVVGQFTGTSTTLTGSASYDPLGAVLAAITMQGNLGYQSGWTDPSTSQVDMGARWYDPHVGQFTSRDSVSLSPVPNSVSANPFAYVDNNPMIATDPSGHCSKLSFSCALAAGTKIVKTVVKDGGAIVKDIITNPGNLMNDMAQAGQDFKKGMQRAEDVIAAGINDVKQVADKAIDKAKSLASGAINAATHPQQTLNKVHDAINKAKNAVVTATKTAVAYVQDHAVEIASFVASTVVFLGCDAALGALSFGVGAVAGAVACGALAGAVGGAVSQAGKCFQGGGAACSLGSFGSSIGMGALGGALGGGFGGALGGKLASGLLGDAVSSFGGKVLGGVIEGGVIGGLTGGATSAVSYGLTCGSNCSIGGALHAAGSGALSGAIGGAIGGGIAGPLFGGRGAHGGGADEPPAVTPDEPAAGPGPGKPNKPTSNNSGCRNSFAPGTRVLMADGSTRPIEDVKIGDKVLATDPATGKTAGKPVTELHLNRDNDLAKVLVDTKPAMAPGAKKLAVTVAGALVAVLFTTQHHPFWDQTTHTWTDAADLQPASSTLLSPDGTAHSVVAVESYAGTNDMRNLTVADTHTYYVVAGETPVLVHNCGGGSPDYMGDAGNYTAGGHQVTYSETGTAVGGDSATLNNLANVRNTGLHDVVAHGTPDGFVLLDEEITNGGQLVDAIRANPNYGGQACRLMVCHSGVSGVGQQVADELGVPVLAPTDRVGTIPALGPGQEPIVDNGGTWAWLYPR